MTKERFIILSDLWGLDKAHWLDLYCDSLKKSYDVFVYDCIQLASIDCTFDEQKLHGQFVEGGISRAVNRLCTLEKHPINLLGFSIGGTIAWKFALKTGLAKRLYCLSSTRLRMETQKPQSTIKLYFGNDDPYKPPQYWHNALAVNRHLIKDKGHLFYRDLNALTINKLLADVR